MPFKHVAVDLVSPIAPVDEESHHYNLTFSLLFNSVSRVSQDYTEAVAEALYSRLGGMDALEILSSGDTVCI